jgi:hypothetical protein
VANRNRQIATGRRIACLIASTALASCSPPLLSPDEPRSPFDRYDAVRNQRADQSVFSDFGRKKPNLEERLSPRY